MQSPFETLYRQESGRVRAAVLRVVGDLSLADDAVQDAFSAALAQWGATGVPAVPRAWLIRAAKNKAIDQLRRRARFDGIVQGRANDDEPGTEDDPDDRLTLLFTCCHPALAPEAQVALTLNTVCGLTVDEIARAFLVPAPTLAQRLVRAKRKIRDAGIPYRVPGADAMPERLDAVCSAVYLVFNEGYAATAGDGLVRAELCEEAIRLGRLLVARMPDEPEVRGLLAAMLVHDARRRTRVDAQGEPVLLDRQDRALWDHAQIEEGCGLIADALRQGPPGPYAVQAAIAALHGEASSGATTDWPQIAALYDVLYSLRRTPVVALNRAVAVAMAFGPTHGLAEMAGLDASLGEYHLYHASRADLLRRVGQPDAAADAYRAALRCVTNDAERRFLRRQLEQVLDGRGASPGAAQTNGHRRPGG